MNFNTILYRFGLDPNDFDNRLIDPIKTDKGFIYDIYQKDNNRICPHCGCIKSYKHGRITTHFKCTINEHLEELLRIYKIRYKCQDCGITFTNPIKGIDSSDRVTKQVKGMICADCYKMKSFDDISKRYNLSKSRIIQIFDEQFSYVSRKSLPKVLCIDEKRFKDGDNSKYCCILYDYENRNVVDVLRSRQAAYLDEYFKEIPLKEREKVKYFVSDMYDGYSSACRKYFPNAIFIVDLFHIVKLLTDTVNSIRVQTMKSTNINSIEYKFMKGHWKYFLCRKENVPDAFFTIKADSIRYHYDDLIFDCLKLNDSFKEAYSILQDFYHYHWKSNLNDAQIFVSYIINRCFNSNNELLKFVGKSFRKWQYGIANSIVRSDKSFHPSNAVAESNNNHIETLIKMSYGYQNFDRFRKRVLLIRAKKA